MKRSKVLHNFFYEEYTKWKGDSCEECGRTSTYDKDGWLQTKPILSVHHLDENVRNNDPTNLLTLCLPCHKNQHGT